MTLKKGIARKYFNVISRVKVSSFSFDIEFDDYKIFLIHSEKTIYFHIGLSRSAFYFSGNIQIELPDLE